MTSQTEQAGALARRIEEQLNQVLVGQPAITRQVLIALITGGHVLIEGVPGLGKTLLARSLARVLELDFQRIQFTPDLMPSDVTGHALFDSQSGDFRVRKGPAFTNLLLADEINRAPAKTQAALLEVMQERQITIEGESFPLAPPFVVLATQNPLDQEGTYPLPEAELDRFLFK
ncbi:MAG TPA: AAA family ATPase, partial [Alcanivorax sp.]|nr:AAA family ATPase [Alcanivorax sp.]